MSNQSPSEQTEMAKCEGKVYIDYKARRTIVIEFDLHNTGPRTSLN